MINRQGISWDRLLLLVGLALLLLALYQSRPPFDNIVLQRENSSEQIDFFPLERRDLQGPFSVECRYYPPFLSSGKLEIIPDDHFLSLKIDGTPYDLSAVPPHQLKDWGKGFTLDLSHLQGRSHTLQMELNNRGGPGGVHLFVSNPFQSVFLLAALTAIAASLLLRRRTPLALGLLLLPALWLAAWHLLQTPFNQHNYDTLAHLEYIQYLLAHRSFPPPFGGWEFHQPPLYYLLMAPLLAVGENSSLFDPLFAIRLFSLACWGATLAVGWRWLSHLLPQHPRYKLALFALLAYWPSGILIAARIGNDPLFLLTTALSLWQTSLWWSNRRSRNHLYGGAFAALALITKASGLVPMALWGLLTLIATLQKKPPPLKTVALVALLWATAGFIAFGESLYWALQSKNHLFMGDSGNGLNSGLYVGNQLSNYLLFDIPKYLTIPYISAWNDATGRQYFLNYLFRSALTGEFNLGDRAAFPSLVLGWLQLLFVGATLASVALYRRQLLSHRWLPPLLSSALFLAALLFFRAHAPAACHNDFRLIVPQLLPAIALLAIWSQPTPRGDKPLVRTLLTIAIALFALSSAALWLLV